MINEGYDPVYDEALQAELRMEKTGIFKIESIGGPAPMESSQNEFPQDFTIRTTLLEEAKDISQEYEQVLDDRAAEYGTPEELFEHIALVFNGFLGAKWGAAVRAKPLTGSDVALLLGPGLKGTRAFSGMMKDDTFGDLTNYCKLGHALKRRENGLDS